MSKEPKISKFKYATRSNYTINAKFQIENSESITYNDVLGAVFASTRNILPKCGLDYLHKQKKVGRIYVDLRTNPNNLVLGYLKIPLDTDLENTLIIAASIIQVTNIGPFKCLFEITEITNDTASKLSKILKSAIDIYRTKYRNEHTIKDFKSKITQKRITNSNK